MRVLPARAHVCSITAAGFSVGPRPRIFPRKVLVYKQQIVLIVLFTMVDNANVIKKGTFAPSYMRFVLLTCFARLITFKSMDYPYILYQLLGLSFY